MINARTYFLLHCDYIDDYRYFSFCCACFPKKHFMGAFCAFHSLCRIDFYLHLSNFTPSCCKIIPFKYFIFHSVCCFLSDSIIAQYAVHIGNKCFNHARFLSCKKEVLLPSPEKFCREFRHRELYRRRTRRRRQMPAQLLCRGSAKRSRWLRFRIFHF